MEKEVLSKWKKAGQISVEALQVGAKLVKPGVALLDVANAMEEYVRSQKADLAFPTNISLNQTAAHDTPSLKDERVFTDNDIVKLDIGAHIDGYAGDNAATIDLTGAHSDLVKASRQALLNVTKIIGPGITLGEIGKTTEETIQSFGFQPVRNLAGHTIERFDLHAGLSIPNYNTKDKTELEPDMVCAIEPFASMGEGLIEEKGTARIHSLLKTVPVRSPGTREVQEFLSVRNGLPFAERLIQEKFGSKATLALSELKRLGVLHSYPPLVDTKGKNISQAEHLFYIGEDKAEILTKKGD